MNKWKLFALLGLILLIIGGMGLFFRQDEVVENIDSVEFKLDNSNRKQTNFIFIDKDVGKFNVVIDTTGLNFDMDCTITVDSSNKNLKFYTDKNYSNELSKYNYIQNNEKKTITIYYHGNNITDEQVSINVENEVKHKNEIQIEIESIEFELDDSDRRQTKSIVIDRDIGEFNVVIDTTGLNFDMDCTITIDSPDYKLEFYTDENYKNEFSGYNYIQNNEKKTITIYYIYRYYYSDDNKLNNIQVDINVENKNKNEIIRDAKMMEQKENFAFWTKEYRKNIKHIIFEKGISNVPKDCTEKNKCFDISSRASKNKVYAYIIDNDLHIASEYEIHAPSNSSYMFKDFEKVESIDFSNFNTMDVTSMSAMFQSCSSLTNLDLSNFNTSKVTDMGAMFKDCSSLISLDLSNFDTSNVIYFGYNLPFRAGMHGMFSGCLSLKSLNVSSFNTANAVNMQGMFSDCSSLTSLNLSSFDTLKVTAIDFMFADCSSLTKLDLSNFNTSKVTTMYGVFSNCSSLTSLNVSNFNTSKVTHMYMMFFGCSSLTSLDLSSFDTSNAHNMSYMFSNCSSLTSLDLSNFNTSKVIDMENMFQNCENLTNLKINFDTSKVEVSDMKGMFSGCKKIITQINIINYAYWADDSAFKNAAIYEGSSIILGYTDETYETVIKMKGNNERIILKKIN